MIPGYLRQSETNCVPQIRLQGAAGGLPIALFWVCVRSFAKIYSAASFVRLGQGCPRADLGLDSGLEAGLGLDLCLEADSDPDPALETDLGLVPRRPPFVLRRSQRLPGRSKARRCGLS